jgi:hypothetical protein
VSDDAHTSGRAEGFRIACEELNARVDAILATHGLESTMAALGGALIFAASRGGMDLAMIPIVVDRMVGRLRARVRERMAEEKPTGR